MLASLPGSDGRWPVTRAVVALVALLPFAPALLRGEALYFRDLTAAYFPWRRFVTQGLWAGELRYWNPWIQEGVPAAPPIAYPPDLLHALLPDERGFSLVLALHVPFAALSFLCLARELGLCRIAAAGAALAYALCGFTLSLGNLYIYLQCAAWAPLVILGLRRAFAGNRRDVARAAAFLAVALSTWAVEFVLQSLAFGVLLRPSGHVRGGWTRLVLAIALGFGLAAAVYAIAPDLVADSQRARGFSTDVVLAHSIHPLTFLQTWVADLYGDLARITTWWWGQNFFPRGFPYFLSLYLGPVAIALAAVGLAARAPLTARLLLLALAGGLLALGRWAGLEPLVDAFPQLRTLRYPSKAFFSVVLAASLLAGLGLQALAAASRRLWLVVLLASAAFGGLLLAAPLLPGWFPRTAGWFFAGLFPPDYGSELRAACVQILLGDARVGGSLAGCAALVALAVLGRRMSPTLGTLGLAAIAVGDLLRAGAGLNPTVPPAFYDTEPAVLRLDEPVGGRGRVFTCDPLQSRAYAAARFQRALQGRSHDVWTFAVQRETLAANQALALGVRTAYSEDLTMLVPLERVFPARLAGCGSLGEVIPRLRAAAVSHVLSLDALLDPELELREVAAPSRIAPLAIHVYALRRPLPLREVAREVRPAADRAEAERLARAPGFQQAGGVAVEGAAGPTSGAVGRVVGVVESPDRLELSVEADRATLLVIRDAFAPGWRAWVDGAAAPVLRADGRHRAVPLPAGASLVVLAYRPPWLTLGCGVSLASALALLALLRARKRDGRH